MDIVIHRKKLDEIIKVLSGPKSNARVGILQDSARSDGSSNAQIGAIHEVGTSTIPKRSWLSAPLNKYLGKALESSGVFNKKSLEELMKAKSMKPWSVKLGKVGLGVVRGAFDSAGYGSWKPDQQPGHSPLLDTHQLKDSVSFDTKEG